MMKSPNFFLTLLFFLVLGTGSTRAQQPNSAPGGSGGPPPPKALIKGKVADAATQTPLEFATIAIFLQKDSSLVTGSITDEKGEFLIETKPGSYFARVEFLSFKSKTISDILLTKDEPVANLGILLLEPDASTLAEVEVWAEKSQMQLSLDKKIFNVGKDLTNAGGTAEDILDNVPSVTVDIDGNVSMRGSGNVRILVDGRPSGLVGLSNTNGLRQLPANLIDKIEVITNPSARYEAEGMAGIINIVLKKQQKKGLNGSFDMTLGTPDQYGTSVNLNFRKDRFNFFVNYGLRYRESPGEGSQYTEFVNMDTLEITDQTRERNRGGWTNSIRLGSDYFFNPKNVLTSALTYRRSNEDNFSEVRYRDFIFDLNTPLGNTIRTDDEKEKEATLEYALTYRKTFDKKGQEFTVDLRFEDEEEEENSNFLEQYFNPGGSPSGIADMQQRSNNKEKQREIRLQADYIHPFAKEGKFETGYLGSIREIGNDYLVEEFTDVAWEALPNLSNNFIYKETIHAAYASIGNKINKFSFQGGIRLEYSDVKTDLLQTNEVNDRNYTNFFPTLHLTYDLAGQNAVQLSYSRRIRRPRFWDLNPFFTYSDARNQFTGNPNLDPEFTDSYEVGHIKYWDKGSLTSAIYYRQTTDVIQRIRSYDTDGNSYIRPENLSTRDDYGLEFTWSFDPFKIWRINGDLNFFRSIIDGENFDQNFNADTYTWFGRFTSKLTLWKKLDVQTTFNYRAPRETTQGEQKAIYYADLGVSMDVLKNNATLTLSGRDLLNTRRRKYITEGENFYTRGDFQWRSGSVALTLIYRVNQKKQRNQEGRKGGGGAGSGGGEMEF
jgi:ferric enterobactin receptor